jgi:hypothetical protein
MSYRDDLDALAARTEALEKEVAHRSRERDDARRLLDEARARAKLPVLANIQVASPCTAAWDEMIGDDRVRHCGQCKLDVFNLSAMTREEAEALVAGRNGRLCVRYFQRTDGTILLKDCTVGVARKRKRKLIAAGAAALLAGGGAAGYALTRTASATAAEPATTATCPAQQVQQVREVSHEAPPPMKPAPQVEAPPVRVRMGHMRPPEEIMGDLVVDTNRF